MKGLVLFLTALTILSLHSRNSEMREMTTLQKGTTTIAFFSKDRVWIAADSKLAEASMSPKKFAKQCKIGHSKNFVWGFAGITLSVNPPNDTVFNADDVMQNAIANGNSLNSSFSIFEQHVAGSLINEFRHLAEVDRKLFDKLVGRPILEVVLINLRDSFKFIARQYGFQLESDSNWYPFYVPLQLQHNMIELGFHDDIDSFLIQNKGYFTDNGDMPKKLEHLILIEAQRHPFEVDSAINVIEGYLDGKYAWRRKCSWCQ